MPIYENNGNQWMWAIVLFFGLLVFGGGGWFGNNGRNGNGIDASTMAVLSALGNRGAAADATATDAAVQRGFDTQAILGKLDGITNGLCDGFYAQNTTMLNGFNGVQRDMCTGFASVNAAINQARFENQQCCCETQKEIAANRYAAERNTCDIITNQNAGIQRILDKMCAQETQQLRDTNLMQAFQLSQQAQNATLINQLRPCPIPAYLSCSPYTSYGPFSTFSGYDGNCNCNCNRNI